MNLVFESCGVSFREVKSNFKGPSLKDVVISWRQKRKYFLRSSDKVTNECFIADKENKFKR